MAQLARELSVHPWIEKMQRSGRWLSEIHFTFSPSNAYEFPRVMDPKSLRGRKRRQRYLERRRTANAQWQAQWGHISVRSIECHSGITACCAQWPVTVRGPAQGQGMHAAHRPTLPQGSASHGDRQQTALGIVIAAQRRNGHGEGPGACVGATGLTLRARRAPP